MSIGCLLLSATSFGADAGTRQVCVGGGLTHPLVLGFLVSR